MWKEIPGYPNYEASPEGKIRKADNQQILKARLQPDKVYLMVLIRLPDGRRVKRYVHRLVALAYCEQKEGSTEVHHINGDVLDNRAENLRWLSKKEHLMRHKNPALSKEQDGWVRLAHAIVQGGLYD